MRQNWDLVAEMNLNRVGRVLHVDAVAHEDHDAIGELVFGWVASFCGEKLDGMYRPLGPVPVPIATLPVAALALLGSWYQSPIAVIAAVILGIGHIGIHLEHLRELSVH